MEGNSRIEDMNNWWRRDGVCIKGSWRKFDKLVAKIRDKRKENKEQKP